jgi:hypothetical protein
VFGIAPVCFTRTDVLLRDRRIAGQPPIVRWFSMLGADWSLGRIRMPGRWFFMAGIAAMLMTAHHHGRH